MIEEMERIATNGVANEDQNLERRVVVGRQAPHFGDPAANRAPVHRELLDSRRERHCATRPICTA